MDILLKTVTGVKHDGIRRLHDLLVNLLSKWLRRAKIAHMGGVGGYKHTSKGLFTEFINHLPKLDPNSPTYTGDPRFRQGIIPAFYANICTKNVQFRAKVLFNGTSTVSQCFQQWYLFWYKQMSLVMLFVLILP